MSRRPGAKGRRDRVYSVFQLPDYGCLGLVCGGVPQTQALGGRVLADPSVDIAELEARTIAAHRTYLEALTTWERLFEADPRGLDEAHAAACETAEARKETCRIAFRDLVDELGYLPRSDAVLSNGSGSTEH